jgi:uncharacterized protein (DUF58 family)
VSPSPRAALYLAVAALSALIVPVEVAGLAFLAVIGAAVADAASARRVVHATRRMPERMWRGVPATLLVEVETRAAGEIVVRQPVPPMLDVVPSESTAPLEAVVVARRRGRHVMPAPGVRTEGPLGLGRWFHRVGQDAEVVVYPDMPAAHRIVLAVRQGRFGESGWHPKGPLGIGTDFESIREYLPDDDVRQINWRATVRMGKPMSNQFRLDQDREVICLVDSGRLMAAPVADRTRLDAALDAVVSVAAVADEIGDRCGGLAVASTVIRHIPPRRAGGRAVVNGLFDLEPLAVDTDYELAFRTVGGGKRSLVILFTDIIDEAAARGLIESVPILTRRHEVVIAGVRDDELEEVVETSQPDEHTAYAAVIARDVLDARRRVAQKLRHAGAEVVEASVDALGSRCVAAYLRAKSRARL